MLTATQIAEWIVRYRADDLGVPVDPMQLQKLVVYAQSFHLALTAQPLFRDEVYAWRDGNVVPSVYQAYKAFGSQPIVAPEGEEEHAPLVNERTERYLEEVVSFLGGYTAIELSDAVHCEQPWQDARRGYRRREPSNVLISKGILATYYRALIADGEEALSRHGLLAATADPRWGHFYVAGICARRMASHPFYDFAVAERLMQPVPYEPPLPASAYDPIRERDYVELGDVSDLTPEEIVRRAVEASRSG